MSYQAQMIKLNVVPGGIIPVVNVSQNDIGRVLQFTIYDGDAPASVPSGSTVTIEGTKPDRHAFQYSASISTNVVTVNTVQQMVIVPGTVECTLSLTYNNQVIGTALFFMEVERSGIVDNADISETVLPVYMEAGRQNMLDAEAWAKGTKNGTPVASGQPQYHNNSKYWADDARATVQGADRYAREAEASANSARAYQERSASSADVSRQYSETAQQNAENGRLWAKSWAVYSHNADRFGHDTNNAQYWADRARYFYEKTVSLAGSMQQKLNSVITVIKMLIGAINISTQSGDSLITQSGDHLIISFAEELYLSTSAGDRVLTENGNNITVSR